MIFLGRHIEIEDPRVFSLKGFFVGFLGQFLHFWGRLNRYQALLLVQKAPENLLRHTILSGPIHCIFGVGGQVPQNIPLTHVATAARGLDCQNNTREEPDCKLSKPYNMAKFQYVCVPTRFTPGKQKHIKSQIIIWCQRAKLFSNVVVTSCQILHKSTEIHAKATRSVQELEKRGKI